MLSRTRTRLLLDDALRSDALGHVTFQSAPSLRVVSGWLTKAQR
jgi:hypothetical protein